MILAFLLKGLSLKELGPNRDEEVLCIHKISHIFALSGANPPLFGELTFSSALRGNPIWNTGEKANPNGYSHFLPLS
jgi:hypothetical protein